MTIENNELFFDTLGIGFGPANIALAISFERNHFKNKASFHFIEAASDSTWQREMLLNQSDIQNIPHRDLITPIDPQSPYTFINYLHKNGRFFDYMNLMITYPLRKDYAAYIKWVADHFSHQTTYNTKATKIELKVVNQQKLFRIETQTKQVYWAKSIVYATGRTPAIPDEFKATYGDKVFHLTRYLSSIRELKVRKPNQELHIGVVGASQSAAEITLDISKNFPNAKTTNLMRNFSFREKDLSSFSYEMLFPGFSDHYFNCNTNQKKRIRNHLRTTNYGSVDADVLHELYLTIYEQKLDGEQRTFIERDVDITSSESQGDHVLVHTKNAYNGKCKTHQFDLVILATGFKDMGTGENQEPYPKMLESIVSDFKFETEGFLHLNRDYSLEPINNDPSEPKIYLNGLCETSHGFSDAGSLSLISLRVQQIQKSLCSFMEKTKLDALA